MFLLDGLVITSNGDLSLHLKLFNLAFNWESVNETPYTTGYTSLCIQNKDRKKFLFLSYLGADFSKKYIKARFDAYCIFNNQKVVDVNI